MKRLVWGIVIAVLGVLSLIGSGRNPQGPAGSIIFGILALAGGGVMIYFGALYVKQKKTVLEMALQLLREVDKINAGELARRLGVSEVTAREHIAAAQRKGTIPFKAEIV